MRVEDLKHWHWAIVGLILGLVVSYCRGYMGYDGALDRRTTMDNSEFERLIVRKDDGSGQPPVKNIAAYKMSDGTYWLTAEQLVRRGTQKQYTPVKIRAATPYVPKSARNAPKSAENITVIDYLKSVKADRNPNLDFNSRWWDHEPVRSVVFAMVGVVLVGGLWPWIVSLLIGAGYGRRSTDPNYDLSRFGQGETAATFAPKPDATPEQLAKLRELEAELERKLAAGESDGAEPGVATAAAQSDQPIRELTGGPVEAQVASKPDEKKDYAGEYYPTETHVKKSH